MKTISWFSAGVSSAVTTKLLIDEIDEIFYTHIDDQHEDSLRFVKECEEWFGKEIIILQSHFKTVDDLCRARSFISGPNGSPCTRALKINVRVLWEKSNPGAKRYVWGYDCSPKEKNRADSIVNFLPNYDHRFPLIEQSISKEHAHEILAASGIKRPKMYDLGYHNNNCIGCVKASSMGYWNKIRIDFPDVFASRSKLERDIGATINKTETDGPIYLDELDPKRGRHDPPITGDCGLLCEVMSL